jgi:chromate transporter
MSTEHIFVTVLICSLLGFGGSGSLPVLRGELSGVTGADGLILHSLAIGNISPGPNGLYLVAIAFFLGGVKGALVAVAAILLPPLLVFAIKRGRDALEHHPRFEGGMRSLALAVVALMCTTSGSLVNQASGTVLGAAMVVFGFAALFRRVPSSLAVLAAIGIGLAVR